MKKTFLLSFVFYVFLFNGFTQTNVGGTYSTNQTWTTAGSPYNVISNIGVPNGITLTIQAGVVVNFQEDYTIIIQGKLLANGNVGDSIVFSGNNNGEEMILFQETNLSQSSLEYIKMIGDDDGIKLSDNNNDLNTGTLHIDNSKFIDTRITTFGENSTAELIINNSTFVDTRVIGEYPLTETITLNNCQITGSIIRSNAYNQGVFLNYCNVDETYFYVGCCNANINIDQSNISNSQFLQSTNSQAGYHNRLNLSNTTFIDSKIDMPVATVNIEECDFQFTSNNTFSKGVITGNGLINSTSFIGTNNLTAIERGPAVYSYDNLYSYNITNCSFYGFETYIKIHSQDDEEGGGSGSVNIEYCDFLQSPLDFAVYNNSPYDISATHNWWGTTNTSEIQSLIFDFWDDMDFGEVNYENYLSGPNNNLFHIDLIPNSATVNSFAGNFNVNVDSDVSWTVSESCDWVTCSPTNGANDGSFSIDYDENITYSSRQCIITVSGNGISSNFTLTQNGITPLIELDPITYTADYNSGSIVVDVTSNVDWNISESSDWLECIPSSGSGNGSFTINFDENLSASTRTYSIIVSGNGASETFVLNQQGATPYLSLDPSSINVNENSGSTDFNITSNINWTVTESCDWISCSPASGEFNGIVNITYDENNSINPRSYNITVSGNGISEEFVITQEGATPYLSINPTSADVGNTSGNTSFNISSNIDWTIQESISWASCSPISGSGNAMINISYNENTSINQRSGNIEISGNGLSEIFLLNQEAGDSYVTISPEMINAAPQSNDFTINVSSNDNWTIDESCDWVTISTSGGTGDGSFIVSIDENNSSAPRNCNVIISTNEASATLEVNQEGVAIMFIMDEIDIDANSGSAVVYINSNIDWEVSENSNWLYCNPTSGSNDGSFEIFFEENNTGAIRSCYITVSGGGYSDDLIVSQDFITAITLNHSVSNLMIYPNPVKEDLFFVYKGESINNAQIQIIDLRGNVIYSDKMNLENKVPQKIELDNYATGNYIFMIKTDEFTENSRFSIPK